MGTSTDDKGLTAAAIEVIEHIAFVCKDKVDIRSHIGACTSAASAPLKEVLETLNDAATSNDGTANSAQAKFKRLAYAAATSIFISGIVGGYSLYDGPSREGADKHALLTVAQIGFGLLGVGLAWLTQKLRLHATWASNRSRAEAARLARYSHVLENAQISDLPLALEYVRKFHVLGQRNYYRDRSKDFLVISKRLTWLRRLALIGLLFVALPLVPKVVEYLPTSYGRHWPVTDLLNFIEGREKLFTFAGLVSTCSLALLAGIGAISLAARNAEQYDSMARFLDHVLAEQIPRLRSAAESGRAEGRDSILAYWHSLRSVLEREHSDWAQYSLKRAEDAMNELLSTWKKVSE